MTSAADAINKNLFLVKEHVGLFKAANNYDIYDPETGAMVMQCREDHLGLFTRIFRFSDYKRMTPFDIRIRTVEGDPVLRVTRGVTIFLSKVRVYDDKDEEIGGFREKMWSIGGKFEVLDPSGQAVCSLKGKWTGWEFAFVRDGVELARVTKKWAGLGKELFTTADTYMLSISPEVPPNSTIRRLILAAVMCIDMVMKE